MVLESFNLPFFQITSHWNLKYNLTQFFSIPSSAESSHPRFRPEPVTNFEWQTFSNFLVGERGQVVEAEQRVGQRGLPHPLLAQHHKSGPGKKIV